MRNASIGAGFVIAGALVLGACNDDSPGAPTAPAPPPAASASAALRVAVLTEEARFVDVALNGVVTFRGLQYPAVSAYVELAPGDYRVQFLPAGQRSPSLAETTLSLPQGGIQTVAIVGSEQVGAVAFADEAATNPDRSGVRLFNAVPDYPSRFDLAVVNGDVLHRAVAYLDITGVALVIPGFYDFELRRSPYTEVVAASYGKGLDRGANFTLFAIGTLRRDDIDLIIARDATF